jgi:hypothetical protein
MLLASCLYITTDDNSKNAKYSDFYEKIKEIRNENNLAINIKYNNGYEINVK